MLSIKINLVGEPQFGGVLHLSHQAVVPNGQYVQVTRETKSQLSLESSFSSSLS